MPRHFEQAGLNQTTASMLSILLLTAILPQGQRSLNEVVDLQPQISGAVDQGVVWLQSRQLIDGSWGEYADVYPAGITPVALFALLKCGVPADHPTIQRGLSYLEQFNFDASSRATYSTGFYLLALAATREKQHERRAHSLAGWLVETLPGPGLYGYPTFPDLSNHVVAVLALDAAVTTFQYQVPEKAWKKILGATLDCLGENVRVPSSGGGSEYEQGFVYRPPGEKSSGSMTSAGITVLHLALKHLGKKAGAKVARQSEQAIQRAIVWLGNHFSLVNNPPNRSWQYFHLYGMERVGSLLNTESFGAHLWYLKGADFLVAQQANGHWPKTGNGSETQSCMALLFLKRATSLAVTGSASQPEKSTWESDPTKDLVIRASGDTPMSIWVSDSRVEGESAEFFARHETGSSFQSIGKAEIQAGRLTLRYSFPKSGKWVLQCVLQTPAGELKSPWLEVVVAMVLSEDLLRYSKDGARNKTVGQEVSLRASSRKDDAHAEIFAFDNRMDSGWVCRADDKEPWILVDFKRAVKAKTILISPLHTFGKKGNQVRPKNLQIIVNKRMVFEVTMADRWDQKTELVLPKKVSIRRLDIRIKSAHGAALGSKPVGIAEIELQ